MKRAKMAAAMLLAFLLFWFSPEVFAQNVKIGVTSPGYDDVGLILGDIGAGFDFVVIGEREFGNLYWLRQFDAIFINCGTHEVVNPDILRRYVEQGGLVYASDLAAEPVNVAFPGKFSFSTGTTAQVVYNADVIHTSLASFIGRDNMDIVFNQNT